MTDQRRRGPRGPGDDMRISREIVRAQNVVQSAERSADDVVSAGLRGLMRHAQQLARVPVRESTERFSRERLLAAAMRKGFPQRTSDPFRAQSLWTRLGMPAIARRPFVSGFAFVAIAGALLLGYMQLHKPLQLAAAAASVADQPALVDDKPLTYSSSGGQPAASNYLVAPARDSASLRFSDGSEVTASPGTRLRVDSTQVRGARVLLEEGSARAHITHRDNTSWKFVAGPFDVRITGTTFTLAWDAANQVLDLTLHEGSVEVESPLGATHLKVKTGQRFHASVTDGTMQLLAADTTERAATDGSQGSADQVKPETHARARADDSRALGRTRTAAHKAQRRVSRAERRANPASARNNTRDQLDQRDQRDQDEENVELAGASFADLVRAGAFEQVVNAATQAGLAQTLERDTAENVRALADAARYLHRTELAVRSLTVLRARFPGTHHSAAAAFLLGRTYENAEQPAAARRFYELYERESPGGEFAAEALAGRMRSVVSLDGDSAARAIAEQYLARYPRGVHSKTAKQLLQ